ncbi:MAG: hypothetical protein JOY56_14350 [Solirubrobacterales bacterium]|nr:hypothetical protein [Solirubrobacterales bacterium]MBV8944093.1 hypothetical protein [Solirubrobacterales bacterium]MBV9362733.1 hypothetical protein [Solirubrobacterales bacterium]MBV9810915.1 hypothetical protein [Solirubrobacterales bacterium]
MSIRKAVRAAVAALIAVGAVSAAAPVVATAATPACGQYCIGVFSDELGTYASPNFVEHVFGGKAEVGTETGLNAASGSDSSEDFINPHQGYVSDYYKLGLVSAEVNRHYGTLKASQLEYAPLGMPTGLCVGVPTAPFQGEPLSLQSCGIPGRTVWIIGTSLSPATASMGFFPIVSGATTDFSRPFAMSYPRHVDTNEMLPPIRLRHLQFPGPARALPATQLWGVTLGPLQ